MPSHGVRLDVQFIGDDEVYNIEMQNVDDPDLFKRVRFYQAQLDLGSLKTGKSYSEMPNTYIIFICNFDPFGRGYAKYTQVPYLPYLKEKVDDGTTVIYLNVQYAVDVAYADTHSSADLLDFLWYVRNPRLGMENNSSQLVVEIDESVQRVKLSSAVRRSYMSLEERIRSAREEGKLELLNQLKSLGIVPRDLDLDSLGQLQGKKDSSGKSIGRLSF